ncbi:MAG: glycosyltransferase family 39 protein [Phycisphaerae bacterium]|nr:glycosyltransferase family 39 protein [Phycisphaerae bacterium]
MDGPSRLITWRWRVRRALPRPQTLGLVLVALGLAWRGVRYGLGFPIWGDEAFLVVSIMTRDFAGLVRPLEYQQIAPLGFMGAERAVVAVAGLSEYALRLVPVACGVVAVLWLWRVARREFPRYTALLIVALFAVSYYPVRHAAEAKPYATDLLVALAVIALALSVRRRPERPWRWVALIAFGAASVWLSYPAVFVVGAAGVFLAVVAWRRRSPGAWSAAVAFALVAGASFVAMYLLYGAPHAAAAAEMRQITTWQDAWPPLARPWRLPWWFLRVHTGNMMAYPVGGKNFGSTATFLLVVAGAVSLWRGRGQRGGRELLVLLLGPLPLMFLAAAVRLYPYGTSARVAQHLAPGICILAGVGLTSALKAVSLPRDAPNVVRIAALVLGGFAVVGIAADVAKPYKKLPTERCRSALRDLAQRTEPGDRWIVFLSLAGEDRAEHAPAIETFQGSAATLRYYVRRNLPPGRVRWAPPPEQIVAPRSGRLRLLVYRDNDAPFPQDMLDAYLEALERRFGPGERGKSFRLSPTELDENDYVERITVYGWSAYAAS